MSVNMLIAGCTGDAESLPGVLPFITTQGNVTSLSLWHITDLLVVDCLKQSRRRVDVSDHFLHK